MLKVILSYTARSELAWDARKALRGVSPVLAGGLFKKKGQLNIETH